MDNENQKTSAIISKDEINGLELEILLKERGEKKIKFLLIDVREEYEYQKEHIVGVDYLIPISEFFIKISQIEEKKEEIIVLQCKLGGRSAQAQRQMRSMGFNNVINLSGGILGYQGEKNEK